ncbi:family 16 glycosylhydrolase [Asticcacaulis sp. AND118]|uniref:glycoside hydrolase family 16 protein n=1 Tax=Asticcacaulis sp. AND118 TaxID=2840468 RepID=UPI001CFF77AC|nr:glycoside hydrolase family 16 protein [Asticcacaulis sp. AND118]UDF05477.1 glycoside hydrolase family 16 protein [Asticcacaulis sp. AND118]
MLKTVIVTAATLAAVPAMAQVRYVDEDSAVPAGYTLHWADEFDKPGLPDAKTWNYDTVANRTGWYNNEKQYYAAGRLENSEVKDGTLRLTARKERLSDRADYGGQAYSSARLITRGKVSFLYGFYEIRAKMPCGLGSWPAIWMLGTEANWPDGGEIDIMEHVGKTPGTTFGTVHNRFTIDTRGGSGDGNGIDVPDACTAFHNYQLLWTPEKLDFFVDGKRFHSYAKSDKPGAWPFDRPQYLLLNLAVGGNMAGEVDDSIFPRTFEVDYVRVWKKP